MVLFVQYTFIAFSIKVDHLKVKVRISKLFSHNYVLASARLHETGKCICPSLPQENPLAISYTHTEVEHALSPPANTVKYNGYIEMSLFIVQFFAGLLASF